MNNIEVNRTLAFVQPNERRLINMDLKKLIIMLILGALVLAGCTTTPTTPTVPGEGTYQEGVSFDPDMKIKASSFASEEEYLAFVKKNSGGSNYYGSGMLGRAMGVEDMAVAMETSESAPTMDKGYDLDYSETNNQVATVDEADIIKTDGNYIYTVSKKTLYIIKAYPGEDAEIVSTIKFDSNPESIFINGDHLAVFGNVQDYDSIKELDFRPNNGLTYFNIYDMSDREHPELTKEYKFEGRYFQARMTNDWIYFITRTSPYTRPVYPTPIIMEDGVVRSMPVDRMFFYPIPYNYAEFANIHAINLADPSEDINSISVAVEGSQNMYMSEENIYITYTEMINEWEIQKEIMMELMEPYLISSDKELIEKIKKTDNDVLSQREKENKIMQIYESYGAYLSREEQDELEEKIEKMLSNKLEAYEYLEWTIIHKITVDNGDISINADGKVPGHVINQFSMDEFDNVFRIATTISARWSRFNKDRTESTNNIYTLDKDLNALDELTGLAEGERIYSTRFIGDKLYMVTFRQVDPFFVIDLSNPNNIKELGELKIPGFSRYLHPYDENTIIGIGRDATEQGRTRGLKISLFDVSDVSNPKEVAKFITDERYAQSTAEYEHKAFLFNKEKELLVIPAYSYDYEDDDGYNGAFVFKITKDDIELRGLIDHSKGMTERWYRAGVERSLFIEDMLYTKSTNLLRINSLEDLHGVKDIELENSDSEIPVY